MADEIKTEETNENTQNATDNNVNEKPQEVSNERTPAKPPPSRIIMRIGKGEPIFRIIFAIIIAVIFFVFPYIMGFWTTIFGWVPVFNLDHLSNFWYLILLWTLARIIGEIFKLIIGRYNKKFGLISCLADITVLISVGIVFLHPNIMNPNFVPYLSRHFAAGVPPVIATILEHTNYIVFAVVLFVIVVDCITTWIKSVKYN